MATDLERLVVSLDADIKKFTTALNRASGATNTELGKVEKRAKDMQRNVNRSFSDLGKGLALGGATAGLTSGVMAFKTLADSATRTQNALKVAGLSGQQLTTVYEQLFDAAQNNAAPVESLVQLYSRVAINQKELGVSSSRLVGFTNNVAKALRVQGTTAEQAQGALLQLSQALGGGTVRAEEFNSILEGAPTILQAVAAGIASTGGSVAELRKIMLEGKLSSREFFEAFERGAPILDQKLKGSVLTVDQAMVQFNNALQDTVGKIDRVAGVSTGLIQVIGTLATTVENLGRIFNSVAQTDAGAFIGKIVELSKQIRDIIPGIGQIANLPADLQKLADAVEPDPISDAASAAEDLAMALKNAVAIGLVDQSYAKQFDDLADGLRDGSAGADDVAKALSNMGEQFPMLRAQLQPLIDKLREMKEVVEEIELEELTITGPRATPSEGALQAAQDAKKNAFLNQQAAESMKSDLERNVETRAKAITDAAAKLGIALSEAEAKIAARTAIDNEASVATAGKVSSNVAELIKGYESFRATPYWDVNAFRVGYGSDTITLADGSIQKVVQGMKISVADANRDLTRRIGEFQSTIQGQIGSTTFGAMNESQQAALTSIAYNYGSLPERIVSAIRTGSTENVYNAIKGLASDNGGINAGRRRSEAELYLNGASSTTTDSIKSKEGFAESLAEQQRMLQQLKEESGLRATLNPLINDYGLKLTELEKAQELFNMAQKEGTAAGKELTSATQLLNGDLSKLTPEARAQAEAMRALATQYGQTTAAANQLKASQEAAAKSSTESLELAKSVTGGILSDIRSALSDGKITWKEWGEIAVNALNKVADKLQEMLLNQLFSPSGGLGGLFGGLFGGFNPAGKVGLFSEGGYTGAGGKNQPAGIVHKGEYVFDAESVRRLGIGQLEALRGYANGGLVGRMPRLPSLAGAAASEVHVYVDDEGGLRAYVQREGRKTEARVASTTKGTFDQYRSNDLRNDIRDYTQSPRRRG